MKSMTLLGSTSFRTASAPISMRECIRKTQSVHMDLCEFEGRTRIVYSWGNQKGIEHLAEAVYDGPLQAFLEGFFPAAG